MWRWGSFFGPWGYFSNGLDGRNAISYRKQSGEGWTKTDNLRIGGFTKINILKGLTLNADYTPTEQHEVQAGQPSCPHDEHVVSHPIRNDDEHNYLH